MLILLIILGLFVIFNILFILGCFIISSKESRAEERQLLEQAIQNDEKIYN